MNPEQMLLQLLPTLGSVAGTALGGPAGGAIGGALGSIGSTAIGAATQSQAPSPQTPPQPAQVAPGPAGGMRAAPSPSLGVPAPLGGFQALQRPTVAQPSQTQFPGTRPVGLDAQRRQALIASILNPQNGLA